MSAPVLPAPPAEEQTATAGRRRRELRIATVDGTELATTHWAVDGARHTLVLLHGLCMDRTTWNGQIPRLLRRLDADVAITVHDHRGHGDSGQSHADAYTVEQLAEDLDDVLLGAGVTGPVTLAGHSLGGMVALAYQSRPRRAAVRVEGLVLCASTAGGVREHGLGRLLAMPAATTVTDAVSRARVPAAAAFTASLRAITSRLRNHGGIRQRALMATAATALATTPLSTAAGFLSSIASFDVRDRLADITAATTVLSGELDVLLPCAQSDLMAERIAGCVHRKFPLAGHMLAQTEPAAVTDAIVDTVRVSGLTRIDPQLPQLRALSPAAVH